MKDDLLNLVATYAAVAETVTWLLIAAALYLTGFATWLAVAVIRRICDSFTRANQLVVEIAAHPDTPELDAGYARLDAATDQHRKEKL